MVAPALPRKDRSMDTPNEQPDPAAQPGPSRNDGHSAGGPSAEQSGTQSGQQSGGQPGEQSGAHSGEQPGAHIPPPPGGPTGSSAYSAFPQSPPPPSAAMPAGTRFFGWIRQLGVVRGRNRWVGGVASGLAERWRIDPVIVRGLVVVLTLFFGVGLLAYGLAWALLPEADGRIHAEEVGRGHWSTGMTGATAFTLLGLIGPGRGIVVGDHDGWWFPWPLLWVAAAVALIVWATNRGNRQGRQSGPDGYRPVPHQSGPAPYGTAPYGTAPSAPPFAAYPSAPSAPYPSAAYPRAASAQYVPRAGSTTAPAAPGTAAGWAPGASPWTSETNPTQPLGPVGAPLQPGYFDTPSGAQRPRPKRTIGPGASTVAIGAGLAILAGALVLLLSSSGLLHLGGYTGATAWAAAGGILGLVIIISGLRGRSSGVLGFFAVVVLLVAGAFSLAPQANSWSLARNSNWTPAGVADAGEGFSIAAGKGTVDLRQVAGSAPLTQDVAIPLSLAAADVTVLLPNDIPVTVQNQLAFARVDNGGVENSNPPIGTSSYTLNDGAQGHSIVLQIHAAAGHVNLEIAENGAQQ
jgi:phage shock protein PspC (stress-responsive transcriptional regulator)